MHHRKVQDQPRPSREVEFERLVESYRRRLCSYVEMRCGFGESDAEDVVQQVFLRIWRRRYRLDFGSIGPAYLKQAAYRAAGDLTAKRQRRLELLEATGICASTSTVNPIHRLMTKELEEALSSALRDLPPADRESFILVASGYTCREAGLARQVSPKTIENQVSRARNKLRVLLEPFVRAEKPQAGLGERDDSPVRR